MTDIIAPGTLCRITKDGSVSVNHAFPVGHTVRVSNYDERDGTYFVNSVATFESQWVGHDELEVEADSPDFVPFSPATPVKVTGDTAGMAHGLVPGTTGHAASYNPATHTYQVLAADSNKTRYVHRDDVEKFLQ